MIATLGSSVHRLVGRYCRASREAAKYGMPSASLQSHGQLPRHVGSRARADWQGLLKRFRFGIDPNSLENWNPSFIRAFYTAVRPILNGYFRAFTLGMQNIPEGPVLFVGVHGGGLISPDVVLAGSAFYRHTGFTRPMFGLAHRMLFNIPGLNRFLMAIGAIEGNRDNALRALQQGHAVMVFPGGEYDVARPFARRNRVDFHGRTGFVRVALEAGVPIVPIGAIGGQGTFFVLTDGQVFAERLHLKAWLDTRTLPLTLSLPWGLMLSWIPFVPLPSRVAVAFGEPMQFSRGRKEDQDYLALASWRVQDRVQALVNELLEAVGNPRMGVGSVDGNRAVGQQRSGAATRVQ